MTRLRTRLASALTLSIVALGVALTSPGVRAASTDVRLGWMEIEGALRESQSAYSWLMPDAGGQTLRDVTAEILGVADRSDLEGLVIRLRNPALTMSQVEEIGAAIKKAQEAGKTVHLFTEIYGPSELLLGSYTDEVIVQAGGAVSLPGLYTEEMYLADTLGLIGVKADMVQIGDYKGASERTGRSSPSKEWDQNISQLLDSMYAQMRGHLEQGRGLSDRELDRAMEEAWLVEPDRAKELGLVDAVIDRLALDDHLKQKYGEFEFDMDIGPAGAGLALDTSNPFTMFQKLFETQSRRVRRDSIALLFIDGAIIDGESKSGGALGGGASVGSLTVREALASIENESRIKGLIVRINSPGGSAIASESIWLGLRRIAEKKPVWVSVGSMAASGGYYIAVGSDRVYVDPSSIVGSIGVVGGKYALGGLYEKLKVHVVPRARGPHASLASSMAPWSDADRAMVRDRMTQTYHQFVSRVEAGRPGIDISRTAEGRLFVGQQAIDLKMADAIGGLDEAMADLASSLGLQEGRYDVLEYPAPKTVAELLESTLGGVLSAPSVGGARSQGLLAAEGAMLLKQLVGERAWPSLRDAINAMAQLRREPVLLTSPRVLLFR